jgi:hypothetical protein
MEKDRIQFQVNPSINWFFKQKTVKLRKQFRAKVKARIQPQDRLRLSFPDGGLSQRFALSPYARHPNVAP